jgi:hypothetical protein
MVRWQNKLDQLFQRRSNVENATEIRPLSAAELDTVTGGVVGFGVATDRRLEWQRMLSEAYKDNNPIKLGEPLDLDNARLYP